MTRARRGGARSIAATGFVLGYGLASQKLIPRAAQVPTNLAAAGAVLLVARHWGATWSELGLDPRDAGRGVRVGLATLPPLAALLAAGAAVPVTRAFYDDDRAVGTTDGQAAYDVLVRIPLAVAVSEELLFRAGLFGITSAWLGAARAAAWTSVAFGVWHTIPALHAHRSNPINTGAMPPAGGAAITVAATVAGTTVAGLAFAGLRLRARSVVAPVIAHAGLNGMAFLTARALGQRSPEARS